MSQPERDMDERVSLPDDAEAVLSAMLAVDPEPRGAADEDDDQDRADQS
jgi:hypothetical protein